MPLPLNRSRIRRQKFWDKLFVYVSVTAVVCSLGVLVVLIADLAIRGLPHISFDFLSSFPSRNADQAGILSAWVGSLLVMLITGLLAIPLGIASGLYLEEYAPKNKITSFIEISITNLAGVPSIVFGLLALGLFVYRFGLGQSILTAGMTLGLLILPIIIVATREAIRSIPVQIREAASALGATKWEITRDHILPYAMGGIMTGIIIAMSRAIGETAPLVTIGALTFIAFLPQTPVSAEFPYLSFDWAMEKFTVLPIQVFNWVSRPQEEFHYKAAAAGIVLLLITMSLNGAAIIIRHYYRKRIKW